MIDKFLYRQKNQNFPLLTKRKFFFQNQNHIDNQFSICLLFDKIPTFQYRMDHGTLYSWLYILPYYILYVYIIRRRVKALNGKLTVLFTL